MKSHCTSSMLKSELIKLIFFFEKEEVRLLYIGVTSFWTHLSPAIFVPVLCLLCLYYACTMPTMPKNSNAMLWCYCLSANCMVLGSKTITASGDRVLPRV